MTLTPDAVIILFTILHAHSDTWKPQLEAKVTWNQVASCCFFMFTLTGSTPTIILPGDSGPAPDFYFDILYLFINPEDSLNVDIPYYLS